MSAKWVLTSPGLTELLFGYTRYTRHCYDIYSFGLLIF
jgi:hypothetical protein